MTLNRWSRTANTNSTADSTVNLTEGQAPGSLNDAARAMMAAVAKKRDDDSGVIATAGTSTAYTATSYQGFTSLDDGISITLRMDETNGAAPTLNVDSLGAKPIQGVSGTAIGTGRLLAGGVYKFTYSTSAVAWIAHCVYDETDEIPSGTVMLFVQTAAPTGWTKSTTHDNKALRIVSGTASSGGSTAFTSVFASRTPAGTVEARTLTVNMMPSHTHTADQGGDTQSISYDPGGASATLANSANLTTNARGGGDSHDHGFTGTAMDFAVQYVDVIAARKN